jgi:hypothetical protein
LHRFEALSRRKPSGSAILLRNNNEIHQKHRGAYSELVAATWLLARGYEVFRNVSSHGPVDLIAMRDGEMFKIDVKTCERFPKSIPQLTTEQHALGVKLLAVYADGNCELVTSIPRPVLSLGSIACRECVKKFTPKVRRQVFCSKQCSTTWHKMHGDRIPGSADPIDFLK